MFLSHCKREAGTEATLLQEALEKIIDADASHPANEMARPVFLDTSDLDDLSYLQGAVEKSQNLLVLLTPQFFSRPWCLVEIVTAVRNSLNLVPVTIQRPGLNFEFPDEDFYTAWALVKG